MAGGGRGEGTECAKTVIPLLVTANVKQARKSEALEKTCKNNNVRAYCKGKNMKREAVGGI